MFLIEYDENMFVNGENIDWMNIDKNGIVSFTVAGDTENAFFVNALLNDSFLNNLQAIDGNNLPIQSKHKEILDKK
jgi:hypothetical protein